MKYCLQVYDSKDELLTTYDFTTKDDDRAVSLAPHLLWREFWSCGSESKQSATLIRVSDGEVLGDFHP